MVRLLCVVVAGSLKQVSLGGLYVSADFGGCVLLLLDVVVMVAALQQKIQKDRASRMPRISVPREATTYHAKL